MRKSNPLLFKYFLVSAGVFFVTIGLGWMTSKMLMKHFKLQLATQELEKACQIILQMRDEQNLSEVQAFQKFTEINPEYLDTNATLFSPTGERLFSKEDTPPFPEPEKRDVLPQENCEAHAVHDGRRKAWLRLSPQVFLRVAFTPSRLESIAHFEKKSSDYRIYRKHPVIYGLMPEEVTALMLAGFQVLGFALSMGTAVVLFRRAVRSAGHTIEELKNGNLKARFLINGQRPLGMGGKLNEMADEIEKLVEHLRFVEEGRTKVLQELAHDLKTPVASLRGLLESLRDRGDQMSLEEKNDFLNTSIGETLYFSRLVEDLLFISGVTHPQYKIGTKRVDLVAIVRDEVRIFEKQEDFSIHLQAPEAAEIIGEELLLKRLIRNAVDNATSFARSKVIVRIEARAELWQIQVIDDGPGISELEIQSFGLKRMTRRSDDAHAGRISLGLGSVIMKKIAQMYGGDVRIHRGSDFDAQQGSTLTITLKS